MRMPLSLLAALLLAELIDGCHHEIVPTVGHFAPSENPERFKQALDPVLRKILAGSGEAPV